jgi:hypothetical protein
MAEIPVTSKGPYRGAYDGPPIEERERHRPKHNFSNFVFRTMTALATAAAFICCAGVQRAHHVPRLQSRREVAIVRRIQVSFPAREEETGSSCCSSYGT